MKKIKKIKTLLIKYKKNKEKIQKLTNYNLFLEKQLLSFDKKLTKKMKNIKENKHPVIIKKLFKMVYELEKKENLLQYHHLLFKNE